MRYPRVVTPDPDGTGILSLLQRYVSGLPDDVNVMLTAVADARTPAAARRSLVGGLNYLLERMDLAPDHLKGVGLIDDAAVLRIAARHAVSSGCDDPAVRALAAEEVDLGTIFGDLAGPLEEYVSRMPWVKVRGRSAAEIVGDNETRASFWKELNHELRGFKAEVISAPRGVDVLLSDLRKMVRSGLGKAGVLKA
jgi:uncharacterized membrane protein YkvA (DUF1232 family)